MKFYKIFLPKKYNDGKLIELKKIREIAEEIRERFGAYSLNPFANLPIIQGAWTDNKTKKTYIEPMYSIELFVEDTFDNQKWLKSCKEIWRQKLNQDELFIVAQDAEIIITS